MPKTGTTSIQDTLYIKKNNQLLLKNGVLYPRCWGANHGAVLSSICVANPENHHSNKFPKALSNREIEKKNQSNMKNFESELSFHSKTERLIISGEALSVLSESNIKRVRNYLKSIGLKQANFKIILYTRDPINWVNSWVQETMKGIKVVQYQRQLDKWKNNVRTLYQDRVGKFINAFGKKSVQVYSFEEAKSHELGIVGHFLEQLDLDNDVIKNINPTRTNDGLSMLSGQFLSEVNNNILLSKTKGGNNPTKRKLDYQPMFQVRGDKFDISIEDKKQLFKITRADRAWLKKNYGIEYAKTSIKNKNHYKNLELSFQDVERVYPVLTKVIRDALVEFLENKFINEIPKRFKKQCAHLITQLKEQEQELGHIDEIEKRFCNYLGIESLDKGLLYRELGLLMEAYEQWISAEMFMRKGRVLRPNSDFIRNKHEKYKQKLKESEAIKE